MKRYAFLGALLLVGVSACSSKSSDTPPPSTGGPTSGTVTGTGALATFTTIANAYWIGNPDVGNAPIILDLFESPIACSAISAPGWDANVNTKWVEFTLWELGDGGTQMLYDPDAGRPLASLLGSSPITSPQTFTIVTSTTATASAAWTLGNVNPLALSGTVTVNQLKPGVNLAGTFDITSFANATGTPNGDTLKGTFDATWCPTGTEP
jgi:hypothetical protein